MSVILRKGCLVMNRYNKKSDFRGEHPEKLKMIQQSDKNDDGMKINKIILKLSHANLNPEEYPYSKQYGFFWWRFMRVQ